MINTSFSLNFSRELRFYVSFLVGAAISNCIITSLPICKCCLIFLSMKCNQFSFFSLQNNINFKIFYCAIDLDKIHNIIWWLYPGSFDLGWYISHGRSPPVMKLTHLLIINKKYLVCSVQFAQCRIFRNPNSEFWCLKKAMALLSGHHLRHLLQLIWVL